jgi:very-short-patch-repair endonuclease/predicted transcriptional regulator of viral defense system
MPVDAHVTRAIVRLSRDQNAAIRTDQLHAAGLTRHAIAARVKRGRLVPWSQGVYIVGDPELLPLAKQSAVLLSLGYSAVLSHRSAAAVWGLAQPDPQVIDVTIVGNRRSREGVRLHRVRALDPRDITTHENLQITTPARALIDFASQAGTSELADGFGEARAKRLVTDARLNAALRRAPQNHPGAAIVRAMLREGGTYDRSKAERLMRRLCRQAELPQPITNIMLHDHLVDFLWPDQRLIVEVDGYGTHGNRQAFESDRRRDQIHTAAGYVVVRITWSQLQDESVAVAVRIAQALAVRAKAA